MADQRPVRIGADGLLIEMGGTDTVSPDLVRNGLPAGGAVGRSLVKTGGSDYQVGFGTPTPDEGNLIDQILTITKSLTLTTDWQDTGIKADDLETGTYLMQLIANDGGAGGHNINEHYSGTMSWYAGQTDSSVELPTDEIVLHRAGASGEAGIYLRTFRSEISNPDALRLQIYSNQASAGAANYVFKFRRFI